MSVELLRDLIDRPLLPTLLGHDLPVRRWPRHVWFTPHNGRSGCCARTAGTCQLITAKIEPPANRKADAEKTLADRLAAIETRLAKMDAGRRRVQSRVDRSSVIHL